VIALCTALVCALATALFFEYLDSRVKTPDEIKSRLGLAYLGLLPSMSKKALGGKAMLITNSLPQTFTEAFRHVRTSVLFSLVEERPKSLLITSTGPGEGKTLVSTNLTIALAQAGNRVLLIDADMRRPKLHATFEEPQEPGLSNVLSGNAKPSEAVIKTSIPNVWLLPAGHNPPNPAELLGSRRFGDVFRLLTEAFDFVLVDSPPLLAVTDALMVARLVGGVVFVVGSEMTNRQAAHVALDRLRAAGAHVLGGLLNRVDLTGNGYYYSKYYHRKYETYYSESA
jgi:succinoglycan biosynthesis transport protein ExoP